MLRAGKQILRKQVHAKAGLEPSPVRAGLQLSAATVIVAVTAAFPMPVMPVMGMGADVHMDPRNPDAHLRPGLR
jgi:hypothetical protein